MHLQYRTVDGVVGERLDEFFKRKNTFVEVSPGNVIMPRKFAEIGQQILDGAVRPRDVWLVSYPRAGSTWAQEMVWLLGNKLDYEGASQLQTLRTPLLELTAILDEDHNDWLSEKVGNSVQMVENLPNPRYIKSHLPWQLLPIQLDVVKPKIIYVARNPKDLCVSYYHYCALVHGLVGTFEAFCNMFLTDKAPIGSMWSHVLAFWQRRNDPNVLFLKYEDMKRDLPATIRRCAAFLEVNENQPLSDEQVVKLCEHLNFNKMQRNPAVNLEPIISGMDAASDSVKFIRKGEVGDWQNHMSADMSMRFDRWIEMQSFGSDLTFDYK